VAVKCYPGILTQRLSQELRGHLPNAQIYLAEECLKTPAQLRAMLEPVLGDDCVFGRMSDLTIEDYLDAEKIGAMRLAVGRAAREGAVVVVGAGAALVDPTDAAGLLPLFATAAVFLFVHSVKTSSSDGLGTTA